MLLATVRSARSRAARRAGFTLLEVLVVVAILVILAGVATIATTSYLENAKKSKAHLGCKGLAQAIESYTINPANPEGSFPNQLGDLLQPPFGGTSLLRNGPDDLMDPWGHQYQMQLQTRADGTQYVMVMTQAPDGTPISQFGIGQQHYMPKF
jgi:general secretion pathway protein G